MKTLRSEISPTRSTPAAVPNRPSCARQVPAPAAPAERMPRVERETTSLSELLNLRVGCWRPPIHVQVMPRAIATRGR
jgi:hypothetical protein